jgi:hypothetical protein
MNRPPCWLEGQSCPNNCAAHHYRRVIHNETPLFGAWAGWRMTGDRLVSPHGEWVAPHILDRLLHARARFR